MFSTNAAVINDHTNFHMASMQTGANCSYHLRFCKPGEINLGIELLATSIHAKVFSKKPYWSSDSILGTSCSNMKKHDCQLIGREKMEPVKVSQSRRRAGSSKSQ